MATNRNARVREISKQLAHSLRTDHGLGGWARCSDLRARNTMKHFLPVNDEEIQNVTRDANQNKIRLQTKPTIGTFLLRAHPLESENAREIPNYRTTRDTQDTSISTNATISNETQEDTEQQTFPTQSTLIRNFCQHGTGRPQ